MSLYETPGLQIVPRGQKLRKQRNPWEGTQTATSLFTLFPKTTHMEPTFKDAIKLKLFKMDGTDFIYKYIYPS